MTHDGSGLVSIGLPVHNGEPYLAQAIESLLGQTYGDFELIISDNASTDSTKDICEEYAARDRRITYARKEQNEGAAANYMATLQRAQGRLFKWAAHDDVCRPTFLERCVTALDEDPQAVLAYPQAVWIDEHGHVTGSEPSRPRLNDDEPATRLAHMADLNTRLIPLFGVIRRTALHAVRPHGRYPGADRILLVELVLHGRFVEIPQPLFEFRVHSAQYSSSQLSSQFKSSWWSGVDNSRPSAANWRRLLELHRAIGSVPLPSAERRRCYVELARWVARYRKRILLDLTVMTRAWLRSARRTMARPPRPTAHDSA